MSWTDVMKTDSHLEDFLNDMKRVNLYAQKKFKEFHISKYENTPSKYNTLEMQDLASAIIDMGNAITMLQKMRKRQEELR